MYIVCISISRYYHILYSYVPRRGCNFGVFHKWGESLWFPTALQPARYLGSQAAR